MTIAFSRADTPAPGSRGDVGAAPSARAAATVGLVSLFVVGIRSWVPAWSIDEAASVMVVRRSAAEVVKVAGVDTALGPYYIALNAWSVVSDAAVWLRLPSVLAAAAAVVVLFVLVWGVTGRRAAWFTAVAMLALPSLSRYGQEARPYAFVLLAAVVAVACWLAWLRTGRRRWAVGLGCAFLALGLLHPYSLLMVPVMLVASLSFPRDTRRSALIRTLIPSAAAGLVLAPFLLLVARSAQGSPDPRPVSLANIARTTLELAVSNSRPVVAPAVTASAITLTLVVLGLTLAGVAVSWRRGSAGRVVAVLLVAWGVLPPTVLMLAQVLAGTPGLVSRYWFFVLPALAWAAGISLDRVAEWRRPIAIVMTVAVVLLGLPSQVFVRSIDGHSGRSWQLLPTALSAPGLAPLPVLLGGWSYRGLLSNDPAFPAARLPLVRDPGPTGLVNPRRWGPQSAAYERLVATAPAVVVYQSGNDALVAPPTAGDFSSFTDVRGMWPSAVLRCLWFGDALGVFTKSGNAERLRAADLGRQLEAVDPGRVRCEPGSG